MAVVAHHLAWHALSIVEVFRLLKTSRDGLSEGEVVRRRARYGPNSLPEPKRRTLPAIFAKQFASTLVIILIAAAGISGVLGRFLDMQVILLAVLIAVIFGFLQEARAEEAMASLRALVVARTRVRRGGTVQEIPSRELVPGDVVLLTTGESVPADGRLMHANILEVSEAPLTGEAMPVEKHTHEVRQDAQLAERKSMAYRGTLVVGGSGELLVTATGEQTEIGKIAYSLATIQEGRTPLEEHLARFSGGLVRFILLATLLIFLVGVLFGRPFFEMLLVSVAIAVAAIPEGLLVGVTVILAVGMRRILKKQGLVRSLVAAETLGSTTVVCVDKTGTLTRGEMVLTDVLTAKEALARGGGVHDDGGERDTLELLSLAVLSSDAVVEESREPGVPPIIHGVPTEQAIIRTALQLGIRKEELLERYGRRLDTLPFHPERKYLATLHASGREEHTLIVRGAPEILLAMSTWYEDSGGRKSPLSHGDEKRLGEVVEALAGKGYRVTACARGTLPGRIRHLHDIPLPPQDLTFVGFLPLSDEIRVEVPAAISDARAAGVRTVMITGDHPQAARAIGSELGIVTEGSAVVTGEELRRLSPSELQEAVMRTSIFARATPADKFAIVESLQARGEVVAMTGDGVNDAPALKRADIGVAVGSGTDVAKETADLVLLDNNFATIIHAIFEGRTIYANVRKMVLYLLADSFSEGILITSSIIAGLPLPLTAAQILWINLVTDGFPNLALTVDEEEKEGIVRERPSPASSAILNGPRKALIATLSLVTGIFTLAFFALDLARGGNLAHARSITFTLLAVDSLFYVFAIRSMDKPFWRTKPFSNRWLLAAVGAAFLFQLAALYVPAIRTLLGTVPLGASDWIIVFAWGIVVILVTELTKALTLLVRGKETR